MFDETEKSFAGPVRLFESEDFIKDCFDNLKLIPEKDIMRLTHFVRKRLDGSVKLENGSTPTFPCIMKANSRSVETRRSVLLRTPIRLRAKVRLQSNSFLEFFFALPPEGTNPINTANLNVRVLDKSGVKLCETRRNLYGLWKDTWYCERLNLSAIGAGDAIIEFSLTADSTESLDLILGEPVIRSSSVDVRNIPPNIIIVCLDTLRADHVTCIGYDRKTTPTLDKIAQEGVLFKNAFAQAGYTLPSHKSFLSGYYPQLFDYYSDTDIGKRKKLTGEIPLIPAYLKDAGYYNIAFTGGALIGATFGFYRSFDFYNQIVDSMKDIKIGDNNKRFTKDSGFENAINWIRENANTGPFFMFLHTYGVHAPYAPPPEYDRYFPIERNTRFGPTIPMLQKRFNSNEIPKDSIGPEDIEHIRDVYDRGIRWIDDEMARFYEMLESEGILDKTILIVLSDHGEEFGEHGKFEHMMMNELDLHVPLIIRYPRLFQQGKVVNQRVELVDVVPTLFEILKIHPIMPLQGRSLLSLARDSIKGRGFGKRPIFGSQRHWKTVKLGDYKYHLIDGNPVSEKLFNLREDPLELNNLLDVKPYPPELKELRLRMLYYIAQNHGGWNVLVLPKEKRLRYYETVDQCPAASCSRDSVSVS